jgi:hypothetical protein
MLTARATINPRISNEASDWTAIVNLAQCGHGHHIGRTEGRRVREAEVVIEDRAPPRTGDVRVEVLRKGQIGKGGRLMDPLTWSTRIQLPVQKGEHDHQLEPHQAARFEQEAC